jgi:hypothetical protein
VISNGDGPDEAALLAGLRSDWPDWEFQVIQRRWTALLGARAIIWASSAQELRDCLEVRSDREPGA